VRDVVEVGIHHLDAYRAGRQLARTTAQKELETLRQFFAFCFERRWVKANPAKSIKSAKNVKAAEVRPYTADEIARIIAACDGIGRGPYERLRARAMVLLLNNTALRICDVATLERARVRDGRILVRTTKTGDTVYLAVWPETQKALDSPPDPRGRDVEAVYYFWNGRTSRRAVVGIAERTLAAVLRSRAYLTRTRTDLDIFSLRDYSGWAARSRKSRTSSATAPTLCGSTTLNGRRLGRSGSMPSWAS
jgi:integrase